ncbi:MAG: LptF/LptG family permease [Gemmatimonadales bacterium]|nr:LptF/LptG family permease [Gemmatimonadales bacterium]
MLLIYRHLLLSVTGPFSFGLFVITFLLMIDFLHKYVDLFVSKGVPFLLVTKFLVISMGHLVALSVPMAVLIGILMGVAQLAMDQEITALKANGISLWRVLAPLLVWANLVGVGLTAYNHFVYPESNHTLANLIYDINRKKPMLEIREHQFTEMNDKMTIFVKKKNDLTGRIEDVTIFERKNPEDLSPRITIATWGIIHTDHANDSLIIELHDGETHQRPDREDPDKYQLTQFGRNNIIIPNMERDFKNSGRKSRSDREMNLTDLWAAANKEKQKQSDVRDRVLGLANTFADWQFNLLDPKHRSEILGNRAAPAKGPKRKSFLEAKFRATVLKAERVMNQAGYQDKIAGQNNIRANRYLVEFHKKFAIPFACVVFALLGVPMAVTTSRSGKATSVTLAIVVYLLYYQLLIWGEMMADRGYLDPFLAMWMANMLLLGLGIPFFLHALREGPSWDLISRFRTKTVVQADTVKAT